MYWNNFIRNISETILLYNTLKRFHYRNILEINFTIKMPYKSFYSENAFEMVLL